MTNFEFLWVIIYVVRHTFHDFLLTNERGEIDLKYVSENMDENSINIAIGGINNTNLSQIKKGGFQMAAICEGIYSDKSDIKGRSKELLEIWNEN